jgi:type I restriction enzyme S subunit
MIDELRPYCETKPTGVPWLAAIPERWEFRRAKRSFRESDDRSELGAEELLSVSHKTGVTPRSQKNVTMFMAESYEGHKLCRSGDIVVNTMWAWMAAVGVSHQVGIVSPSYGVYRARSSDAFIPRFLDYLLRTEVYRAEYVRSSRGITTSRLRLYPDDFLEIPFVQPPSEEQRRIVRFLDAHGALTARLIRAKQRLIKLLEEQKQAIIHRAVTRGLDPDVRLKPSGIPWLGDVPAHWQVTRLKAVVRNVVEQRSYRLEGEPYVALEHIEGWTGRIVHHDFDSQFDSAVKAFKSGDVLFGKLRPYLAKVTKVERAGVCVGEFLVLRSLGGIIDPSFLELRLRAPDFINIINRSTVGAKMPRAEWRFVGSLPIVFPYSLDEQEAVVRHIRDETIDVEQGLTGIRDEIALYREFRARLIADVVTGKLDVRAAAAALPEITEPEPIDEPTDGEDLEAAIDDAEDEAVAA